MCFYLLPPPQILINPPHSNGRQTVGDGAFPVDTTPMVVAVCHRPGRGDLYYYSTTFSGGPEVKFESFAFQTREISHSFAQWRF